jgi:hypothetical protein
MENREIDWDAIVARAREQDERSAIKPAMRPKALRSVLWAALGMIGLGFAVGHFWPW